MAKNMRKESLRMEREQAQAFNRGDVKRALATLDRGFAGFSSTQQKRIRGLGALARIFHDNLRRALRSTYRIAEPEVLVAGPVAIATFCWTVGLGKGRAVRDRGTHVYARRGSAGGSSTSTSPAPTDSPGEKRSHG